MVSNYVLFHFLFFFFLAFHFLFYAQVIDMCHSTKYTRIGNGTQISYATMASLVCLFNWICNAIQCTLEITIFKTDSEATVTRNSCPSSTVDAQTGGLDHGFPDIWVVKLNFLNTRGIFVHFDGLAKIKGWLSYNRGTCLSFNHFPTTTFKSPLHIDHTWKIHFEVEKGKWSTILVIRFLKLW